MMYTVVLYQANSKGIEQIIAVQNFQNRNEADLYIKINSNCLREFKRTNKEIQYRLSCD
jgi:low affinity Fe/Cu permease